MISIATLHIHNKILHKFMSVCLSACHRTCLSLHEYCPILYLIDVRADNYKFCNWKNHVDWYFHRLCLAYLNPIHINTGELSKSPEIYTSLSLLDLKRKIRKLVHPLFYHIPGSQYQMLTQHHQFWIGFIESCKFVCLYEL